MTLRWRRTASAWALFTLTLLLSGCATTARSAPATEPLTETRSGHDTFALLQEAAEHEGLYTLIGGLKPMSSGIWQGSFRVAKPDLTELRSVRTALAPLSNDIWYADVQVFDFVYEGQRSAHAYVVHRTAFANMITRYATFWSPWGITPDTHPSEVVAMVDRMPKADRWRGYGYLFGYPPEAVDFFIAAGLAADNGQAIGPGKDRQFIQIPTHAADSGRFTYAVPLHHVPSAEDEVLAREAERILAAYSQARGRMRDAASMIAELRRLNAEFQDQTNQPIPRPSQSDSTHTAGSV